MALAHAEGGVMRAPDTTTPTPSPSQHTASHTRRTCVILLVLAVLAACVLLADVEWMPWLECDGSNAQTAGQRTRVADCGVEWLRSSWGPDQDCGQTRARKLDLGGHTWLLPALARVWAHSGTIGSEREAAPAPDPRAPRRQLPLPPMREVLRGAGVSSPGRGCAEVANVSAECGVMSSAPVLEEAYAWDPMGDDSGAGRDHTPELWCANAQRTRLAEQALASVSAITSTFRIDYGGSPKVGLVYHVAWDAGMDGGEDGAIFGRGPCGCEGAEDRCRAVAAVFKPWADGAKEVLAYSVAQSIGLCHVPPAVPVAVPAALVWPELVRRHHHLARVRSGLRPRATNESTPHANATHAPPMVVHGAAILWVPGLRRHDRFEDWLREHHLGGDASLGAPVAGGLGSYGGRGGEQFSWFLGSQAPALRCTNATGGSEGTRASPAGAPADAGAEAVYGAQDAAVASALQALRSAADTWVLDGVIGNGDRGRNAHTASMHASGLMAGSTGNEIAVAIDHVNSFKSTAAGVAGWSHVQLWDLLPGLSPLLPPAPSWLREHLRRCLPAPSSDAATTRGSAETRGDRGGERRLGAEGAHAASVRTCKFVSRTLRGLVHACTAGRSIVGGAACSGGFGPSSGAGVLDAAVLKHVRRLGTLGAAPCHAATRQVIMCGASGAMDACDVIAERHGLNAHLFSEYHVARRSQHTHGGAAITPPPSVEALLSEALLGGHVKLQHRAELLLRSAARCGERLAGFAAHSWAHHLSAAHGGNATVVLQPGMQECGRCVGQVGKPHLDWPAASAPDDVWFADVQRQCPCIVDWATAAMLL